MSHEFIKRYNKFDFKNKSISDLLDLLNDDSSNDWLAAYTLGNSGDISIIPQLLTLIDPEDYEGEYDYQNLLFHAVVVTCGKLKDKSAVEFLINILLRPGLSKYNIKNWSIAWALGEIGDSNALGALEKVLNNDDYESYWTSGSGLSEGYLSPSEDDDIEELEIAFLDYIQELWTDFKNEQTSPVALAIKKIRK